MLNDKANKKYQTSAHPLSLIHPACQSGGCWEIRDHDYVQEEPIKMQKHQTAELKLQGCPFLAFPNF